MNYTSVIRKQSTIIAVSVFVMVIGIIGTSYALFMKVDQSEEQTVQSGSLIMQLSPYDGSTVISSNNTPIDDNEGILTKGYSFSVTNSGTLPITYYIALYNNPDDTSTNKLDFKYIKVSLDSGTPFLLSSITTKDSSGRAILKQGITLAPNKYDTHNIKVWIDEDTPESEIGKSLSLKIYAYGEVCENGDCSGGSVLPASTTISNLAKNDTVNFASDDPDNNVRYIGANPNNYVYFNCSDYNNPMADTCEKWRIIGVFNNVTKSDGTKENLVKIIRDESIGIYDWNDDFDTYYTNSWQSSTLQQMLNSGDYYTTTLKNDTTRNAIEDVAWNLGGSSTFEDVTASMFYERERGSNYPKDWTGKIGLMYPSDYGYATSGSSSTSRAACLAKELYNWDSECYSNNYLYDDGSWMLTSYTDDRLGVFCLPRVGYRGANGPGNVKPTFYLKSSISVDSGTGESSNPYQLKF